MKNQRPRTLKISLTFIFLLCYQLSTAVAEYKLPEPPPDAEKCTVWLFLDPECPICQNYTLTLRQMHETYAGQGVSFQGVYTSPVIKKREIKAFHKKYQLPFSGKIDKKYALAERWDATVTPEVVVTSPIGEVLYQGAIDNWYYALGKNRPEPTEHYLQDALNALLAGQPIEKKRTKAVGCLMNR